jgi:branched-chain amino acid transport system permease protein
VDWVNVILQGILVGGLYAMFAAGLSLIFGVMRLVNIAHGDLIVLAAYVALVTTHALGIGPLTSLLIVVPVMALIGYVLQWLVLNRTLGDDLLPPLLVTFGLSVICSPPTASNCRPAKSKLRPCGLPKASMSACCRCCNSPSQSR